MQGNLRQQRVRLLLHVQGEKVIVNGLVHTTKVVDTELQVANRFVCLRLERELALNVYFSFRC